MEKTIRGRAIKLGDFVNTDEIAPIQWMNEGTSVLKVHVLEGLRPGFHELINKGDILVGGRNFGCGSHREQAMEIMQTLGVAAIVADSVARIYFRNGIAFGMPIFQAEGVSGLVEEGEEIEISFGGREAFILNLKTGRKIAIPPMPEVMMRVLEKGGIYNLLCEAMQKKAS